MWFHGLSSIDIKPFRYRFQTRLISRHTIYGILNATVHQSINVKWCIWDSRRRPPPAGTVSEQCPVPTYSPQFARSVLDRRDPSPVALTLTGCVKPSPVALSPIWLDISGVTRRRHKGYINSTVWLILCTTWITTHLAASMPLFNTRPRLRKISCGEESPFAEV